MKIIFALLLIIFLAFSGYHLSFRNFKLPLFARHFYMRGIEFLFLGLLLGPQYLNLIDSKAQDGLAPLAALVLGWIGLLYGFQFEIKKLRRFPLEYAAAANLQGGLTLFLVLFGAYFTLAMTVGKMIQSTDAVMNYTGFVALFAEIIASIALGAIAGKGIAVYIDRAGHDLPLFLLFFGFGATKVALWLSHFMEAQFDVALHLEPLLICMSAGSMGLARRINKIAPSFASVLAV